jgi:hypothetical protein
MKTIVALVLVLALIIYAIAFWVSRVKRIPQSTKIADCTNTVLKFSFIAPPGNRYNFALGIGGARNLAEVTQHDYKGKFQITDGKNEVFALDFDSKHSRSAFWLRKEDELAGYILTLPNRLDQPSLDRILRPKTNYEVIVTFSDRPPTGSSLWLNWRQNRIEGAK